MLCDGNILNGTEMRGGKNTGFSRKGGLLEPLRRSDIIYLGLEDEISILIDHNKARAAENLSI